MRSRVHLKQKLDISGVACFRNYKAVIELLNYPVVIEIEKYELKALFLNNILNLTSPYV